MTNQYRQSFPPEEKIEEILTAFGTYALGDIKHNIDNEKPISAFILCSCLIDQMAYFAYNHSFDENEKYYKQFIKDLRKSRFCAFVEFFLDCNQISYGYDKYFR